MIFLNRIVQLLNKTTGDGIGSTGVTLQILNIYKYLEAIRTD